MEDGTGQTRMISNEVAWLASDISRTASKWVGWQIFEERHQKSSSLLLLTLLVQVRHTLTKMEDLFGGVVGRQRRRAGSPLGVVGSLAQSTIGLTSQQSYQTLQVNLSR